MNHVNSKATEDVPTKQIEIIKPATVKPVKETAAPTKKAKGEQQQSKDKPDNESNAVNERKKKKKGPERAAGTNSFVNKTTG